MVDATITNPTSKEKRKIGQSDKPLPIGKFAIYAVLAIGVIFSMIPFLWMLSWSVMTRPEVIVGRTVPAEIQWQNYPDAWVGGEFSDLMWNSVRKLWIEQHCKIYR